MKKVALIVLHGMGKVDMKYHHGLERELRITLGDQWDQVSFQVVQYAKILQNPQDELWQTMRENRKNKIGWQWLRNLFLSYIGDAASLEISARAGEGSQYIAVQQEIQNALKSAYNEMDKKANMPVIILAHSLGCQVISNYLWDAKSNNQIFKNEITSSKDELDFIKLKSLTNLVTIGCNIPIFISGLKKRECFKVSNSEFVWDNYYAATDVLGWPLGQLDTTFEKVNDHPIKVGGFLTSWNPLCHMAYWSEQNVIKPLVNILRNQL